MPNLVDPDLIPSSPNLLYESTLWLNETVLVAGIDEAGRGAWAGPVVAGMVIFPICETIPKELLKVRDSKQLTAVQRAELAPVIKSHALYWGIGFSTNIEIDEIGILPATKVAMTRALEQIDQPPDHLLIDALFLPEIPIPQTALYKGDQRSFSIAAASILAKNARDEYMIQMNLENPFYGFDKHKGYGTKLHQERLSQNGSCYLHRHSFRPIKNDETI
jgi:ribonuclease HII